MTTPEQQWLEIYVRMVAGEPSEEPFEGVLEVREDEDSDELTVYRVRKDRHRWRVETADGRPVSIQGDEHVFSFRGRDVPVREDRRGRDRSDAYDVVDRPAPAGWPLDHEDGDFTRPAASPRRVTYLGREAWEVTLLPPRHKESPLVVTVDALNGMLLEERSPAIGVLRAWREIEPVNSFAPATFGWDGDFVATFVLSEDDEPPEEIRGEVMAERARAAAFRGRLGLESVRAPVELELENPWVDEDGSVSAWFRAPSQVRFARSRVPEDPDDGELQASWRTPGGWTWTVGASEGGPDLLEAVRAALEPRSMALDDFSAEESD